MTSNLFPSYRAAGANVDNSSYYTIVFTGWQILEEIIYIPFTARLPGRCRVWYNAGEQFR